jgi:GxxExxY protein
MNTIQKSAADNIERVAQGVIACVREVGRVLGPGLAVGEYEDSLARLLQERKLKFARQYPVGVPFSGPPDRGFRADFFVETWVLLELKALDKLTLEQTDEALNYLRESGARLCLLINFGRPQVEIQRILPSGDVSHA